MAPSAPKRRLASLALAWAATSLHVSDAFLAPRAPLGQAVRLARGGAATRRLEALYMSVSEPPAAEEVPSSAGTGGGGATDVLARKAKEREVAAFKASLPRGHPIFTELEKVGSYNASSVLWSALKRRYDNTLSVLPEYSRKAPFAYLGSVLEPREYSKLYRDAGAHAIAVNVDTLTGGCSHDDIRQMVEEQSLAVSDDVTAPLPVIATDTVVDPVQISRARLAGAAGITLRYGLNSPEVARELIGVALGLGMEPVVLVRSPEEAHEARAAGARLFYLIGHTRQQGMSMRESFPDDVLVGFDLRRPAEYQYGLAEVEDAWVLRDAGFHSVYASNVLWQTSLDDVTGPVAVIRALKAKACHFLVDPVDWISKVINEGSKETLGELMM